MSKKANRYRTSEPREPRRKEDGRQEPDYLDCFWHEPLDLDDFYDDSYDYDERSFYRVRNFGLGGKIRTKAPKPVVFHSFRFALKGDTKRKFSKNGVQFEVDDFDDKTTFSLTGRFPTVPKRFYYNADLLETTGPLTPSHHSFYLAYNFVYLKSKGFKCKL